MGDAVLLQGDARRLPLAAGSVHCVVTSPPYFSLRDYGIAGQIGLEESPAAYVAALTAVFRKVWRVLRDDGTCWINLGDSYAGSWGNQGRKEERGAQRPISEPQFGRPAPYPQKQGTGTIPEGSGLKPKDLIGIPWRVALALQADGWYLRSDIIWSKPNPMPESVTDRPTKSHEYLFLLAKDERYYYDADAIREPNLPQSESRASYPGRSHPRGWHTDAVPISGGDQEELAPLNPLGRNRRSVWTVSTTPFPGAHFATFPPRLIEPCIKAGTSERGCCPACGAGWERVVARTPMQIRPGPKAGGYGTRSTDRLSGTMTVPPESKTTGWRPACPCNAGDPIPCVVLDPFAGASTTLVVATGLGRRAIGTDLNPDYLRMGRRRLDRPHAPVERPSAGGALPLFDWQEAPA